MVKQVIEKSVEWLILKVKMSIIDIEKEEGLISIFIDESIDVKARETALYSLFKLSLLLLFSMEDRIISTNFIRLGIRIRVSCHIE